MKCYKYVLTYSWILQRQDIELKAYDKLSLEYFYLGNIEKTLPYHNKFVRGIVEPQNSSIRSLTLLKYNNKRKQQVPRKIQKNNYDLAVKYGNGFVSRIRDILETDDQNTTLLGTFDYDEVFRIMVS